MPNLPTSLILALLAIAWLWVLVPMFARSREAVPETDDESAGFRVLRRAKLRRPSRRRDADVDHRDGVMDDDTAAVDADFGLEYDAGDDTGLDAGHDARPQVPVHARGAADERPDEDLVTELADDASRPTYYAADRYADPEVDVAPYDTEIDDYDPAEDDPAPRADVTGNDHAGHDDHAYDAADEWQAERRAAPRPDPRVRPPQRRTAPVEPYAGPRPHRPGRGGFDPEQAAATARYRFRRRRTVCLLLVLVMAGAGTGAVLLDDDRLWGGVALAAVLLAGYLTYLSRQVRIEREIAERRMARLRRARQLRPLEVHEAEPASPYREQQQERPVPPAPRQQPAVRPGVPVSSHVPVSRRRGYTVVDLDDDDPAFDDLEHYEPMPYRRAAGQ